VRATASAALEGAAAGTILSAWQYLRHMVDSMPAQPVNRLPSGMCLKRSAGRTAAMTGAASAMR
jgi:hypothetical protein